MGLLEHEFRIAPEQYAAIADNGSQVWKPATEVSVAEAVETVDKGDLYVVNDDGERKATGAYYTPDYIVMYIVEETIDPLLDDIDTALRADGLVPSDREYFARFWQSVLDLTILDPAMGSGHFLTTTTGYLTERVMEVVREQEIQSYDEQDLRREIAKECIYGVDLNNMAVELAKLSMWLETLAADQPLAFLDHHLKTGNSLVGSDITDVLADEPDAPDGQWTLMQAFAKVRQRTLEHVMTLMQDLLSIDNETLADVKSMKEIYETIQDDPLYQRLFELANVHTAECFGLDVPADVYEVMAQAIEDEDEWVGIRDKDWFQSAQTIAGNEQFFHWDLEFPEVFFDKDGEKMVDAGFDAVIGNPPYVRQEQLQSVKPYLEASYETYQGVADLYVYFIEQGGNLLRKEGKYGNIVSNKFTRAEYGRSLRELLENKKLEQLIDFGSLPVFPNATAYPLILIFTNDKLNKQRPKIAKIDSLEFLTLREEVSEVGYTGSGNSLGISGWSLSSKEVNEIISKIESVSTTLQNYISDDIYYGLKTGLNDAFFLSQAEKEKIVQNDPNSEELIVPLAIGNDINRYGIDNRNRYLILIMDGWTKQESGKANTEEAWNWLQREYPGIAEHLKPFSERAKSRYDKGEFWWELRPCDYYEHFEQDKIVYPVISKGPRFALDDSHYYVNDKCFIISRADYTLLAVLNSKLAEFWVLSKLSGLRGGFQEFRSVHMKKFPVQLSDQSGKLDAHARDMVENKQMLENLNLSLLPHLGNYGNCSSLSVVGFTQPPENAADSVLQETTAQKPNLRVGEGTVVRESANTVEIRLTARYKPDDEDANNTDRWGYTETDPLPALRITDLTETEANLIEAFVPVAVDKAGGFAGFRETATKTNSLIDRLEALTLPQLTDIEDGLERYRRTKERAEELREKIEKTDKLIDQIVYQLYGLTDKEIEIIESSLEGD